MGSQALPDLRGYVIFVTKSEQNDGSGVNEVTHH
jgi:hypothetical protein